MGQYFDNIGYKFLLTMWQDNESTYWEVQAVPIQLWRGEQELDESGRVWTETKRGRRSEISAHWTRIISRAGCRKALLTITNPIGLPLLVSIYHIGLLLEALTFCVFLFTGLAAIRTFGAFGSDTQSRLSNADGRIRSCPPQLRLVHWQL